MPDDDAPPFQLSRMRAATLAGQMARAAIKGRASGPAFALGALGLGFHFDPHMEGGVTVRNEKGYLGTLNARQLAEYSAVFGAISTAVSEETAPLAGLEAAERSATVTQAAVTDLSGGFTPAHPMHGLERRREDRPFVGQRTGSDFVASSAPTLDIPPDHGPYDPNEVKF